MTDQDRETLRQQLVRHEGLRLKPYRDTLGYLTIGVGRNLDGRGITEDEAMTLLDHDLDLCLRLLTGKFAWFASLDPIRQRALVDLCFNLGMAGLLEFRQTLASLERGDYAQAGQQLQASRWFRQVGLRGPRIVGMIATGREPV